MPLTLITGPANAAKVGAVLERLRALAPHDPLLVVPTGADVTRYRRELAGAGLVFGPEVTTFDGLLRELARRLGVSARPLGRVARGRVVRAAIADAGLGTPPAPAGGHAAPGHARAVPPHASGDAAPAHAARRRLAAAAGGPGFARAAEALVAELQRSMVSPARLQAALRAWRRAEPDAVPAHLDELGALYAAYRTRLERMGRADREGLGWAALDALRAAPQRWGRRPVLLYGFDDLTPTQLDAVEALVRRAEADVTVALPYEPGRAALAGCAATVEVLRPLAERHIALPARAEHYRPGSRDALHHLERGLFEPGAGRAAPGGAVRLLEAGGERPEAELVGAEVLELLESGIAPEEIAIVVRGDAPADVLAGVLTAYGVPLERAQSALLGRTRLGAGLLAAARAALPGGTAGDVLRWLRTPGVLADEDPADDLEARLRRAEATFAREAERAWEAAGHPPLTDLAALREAAAVGVEALLDALVDLAERTWTGRHHRRAALLGPDERADARAAAGLRGAARELRDVLAAVAVAAPGRDAAVAGPGAPDPPRAAGGLPTAHAAPQPPRAAGSAALPTAHAAPDPPRVAVGSGDLPGAHAAPRPPAVAVGSGDVPAHAAPGPARAAGSDDHPAAPGPPSVAELAELLEALAEVEVAPERNTGGVLLADPLAVRARRFRAVVMCGLQDGVFPGHPVPEPFLDDAARRGLARASGLVLPLHEDVMARERALFYECVSRPEQALLLSWRASTEEGDPELPSPFLADVRALFGDELWERRGRRLLAEVAWEARDAPTPQELRRARAAASPGPEPGPLAAPATAEVLAGLATRDRESARGLETFAACGVRWLVEHVLRPDSADPDPEPLRRGALAHAVLERALTTLREQTGSARLDEGSLPAALAALDAALDALAGRPRDTAAAARRRALEADLQRVLREEAERGPGLEPTHLEWRFGGTDDPHGPVPLGEGAPGVTGRVDRVDVDPATRAAVVRDYKGRVVAGGGAWAAEGKLQVALYALAVRERLGVDPAAAVYQPVGARDPRPRGVVRDDLPGAWVGTDRMPAVGVDAALEEARAAAHAAALALRAGRITACPERCSPRGCAHPEICRAAEGAARTGR